MTTQTLPALITLISLGLVVYTYAGYPALLWLLNVIRRRHAGRSGEPEQWPAVSIILSAYNEETVIGERMKNLLALDYPRDQLEILVGSDGSTDRTCEIVNEYQTAWLCLIPFEKRRGKTRVLNDLVSRARGEIVVMTDANTFFCPDAVQELVKALRQYPSACAVVGRLDLHAPEAGKNLDSIYWRYETRLKMMESRFGCVLGANGAIYAFRREHYQPLPPAAIVDDFLIPMLMRLHSGRQVFFVPTARAWETSPERVRDEFRRRVRIGTGDLQALFWTWRLLLPWKGMVALAYLSHKVLRWFGPWFLLTGFIANLWLLDIAFFQMLFAGQLLVYGLGIGATIVHRVPVLGKAATGARYFLVLNAALLLGFVRFALGLARPTWDSTPRRA